MLLLVHGGVAHCACWSLARRVCKQLVPMRFSIGFVVCMTIRLASGVCKHASSYACNAAGKGGLGFNQIVTSHLTAAPDQLLLALPVSRWACVPC